MPRAPGRLQSIWWWMLAVLFGFVVVGSVVKARGGDPLALPEDAAE